MPLLPTVDLSQFHLEYSASDQKREEKWVFNETSNNWKNQWMRNYPLPWTANTTHNKIHSWSNIHGRDSLSICSKPWITGPGRAQAVCRVTAKGLMCQKNDPKMDPYQRKKGRQYERQSLFEDWQIDFTQMPKSWSWKDLLVFVDIFSGWVEASEVVTALLKDIIPWVEFLTVYKW